MERTGAQKREPTGRLRTNRSLIEARLNAGLTPNDLAYRAGVSGNTVRAAERGLYVGPRAQYAISRALDLTPLIAFPWERQREAAMR